MFSHMAADAHPMQASLQNLYFGLTLPSVNARRLCNLSGFRLTPAAALALSTWLVSWLQGCACVSGGLPASGPSDSVLAGHQLHGAPGPFWAPAQDPALHFRGGGSDRGGWATHALSVCGPWPFGRRQNHLHGHPFWPKTRPR